MLLWRCEAKESFTPSNSLASAVDSVLAKKDPKGKWLEEAA